MSNYFNPGSPKFRRGVFLLSLYSCSVVSAYVIMADFGIDDHVFTPIQKYVNKKVDTFYGITAEELAKPAPTILNVKNNGPSISIRRIDLNKDGKQEEPSK